MRFSESVIREVLGEFFQDELIDTLVEGVTNLQEQEYAYYGKFKKVKLSSEYGKFIFTLRPRSRVRLIWGPETNTDGMKHLDIPHQMIDDIDVLNSFK